MSIKVDHFRLITAVDFGRQAEILIRGGMDFPLGGEDVKWDSFPVTEIVIRGWVTGFDTGQKEENAS